MYDFSKAIGFVAGIASTTKRLLDTREEVKVNQVAIQLQDIALGLQTEMFNIQAQYQEVLHARENLEKKLVHYENWDSERARYQLETVGRAAHVYTLKKEHRMGETPHWLCPTCYQDRQKTILQRKDGVWVRCPRCKTEISTSSEPAA